MNRFTTTMIMLALAVSCQLANSTPPGNDKPSVVVGFADLDLTHRNGVAILYRRLKEAAETVCASQNGRNGHDIASQTRYKVCWRSALTTAVTKVDQPALTAFYRAQSKDSNAPVQVAEH